MPSRTMHANRVLRFAAAAGLVAGTLTIGAAPVGAASPGRTPLTITADQPPTVAPKGHLWAFNDFFPRSLTVHKGQTIRVALDGFHTATFLPHGMSASADLRANGIITTDPDDATRNPGGQTHTQARVPALLPTSRTCGTSAAPCSFTGATVVSSGAPLGPPAGPFVVTINAPVGVYTLLCRIHPGMTASIRVAPASAPATTVTKLRAAVKAQIAADLRDAAAAEKRGSVVSKSTMSNGHTHWVVNAGASSPSRHVAILEFLPGNLNVKPGDEVTFRSPAANEPHTVTFPQDFHTDLVAMCEDATTGTDAPAALGDPQQGPFGATCGTPPAPADEIEFAPGNGVRTLLDTTTGSDSGLLASRVERAAFGLPSSAALSSWTITLADTAPKGTYTFVCQIHDGMKGTLVIH